MAQTTARPPDVAALAEGLHRPLSRLFAILRRGDISRGDHGDATGSTTAELTLAQLSILITLIDRGPIRMTELAAHERVRTPTTTVAIRRLEKIGLVKRTRDPSDLRAVLVEITPAGLEVHRQSLANRHAALASMLSHLSREDLDTLTAALAPLERLASYDLDAEAVDCDTVGAAGAAGDSAVVPADATGTAGAAGNTGATDAVGTAGAAEDAVSPVADGRS